MIEISTEARNEIEKVMKENQADRGKAVRIYIAGHG
jgi:Fe-S cluster assembly iron-binding protein IscA